MLHTVLSTYKDQSLYSNGNGNAHLLYRVCRINYRTYSLVRTYLVYCMRTRRPNRGRATLVGGWALGVGRHDDLDTEDRIPACCHFWRQQTRPYRRAHYLLSQHAPRLISRIPMSTCSDPTGPSPGGDGRSLDRGLHQKSGCASCHAMCSVTLTLAGGRNCVALYGLNLK